MGGRAALAQPKPSHQEHRGKSPGHPKIFCHSHRETGPRQPHTHRFPATLTLMRPLVITTIAVSAVGILLATFAALTWPVWDSAAEYERAVTSYAAAGAGSPDPTAYLFAPDGHYTLHIALLAGGAALISVGILGALLSLHAKAIRAAL